MRVTFLEPRKNLELYLPRLEELIERLIRDYGADTFYFCEMTRFTYEAMGVLQRLREKYPFCETVYVIADNPDAPQEKGRKSSPRYVYLSALSVFGKRDSAFVRDVWMIDNCDIVVLYPPSDQKAEQSFRNYVYTKEKTVVTAE